MTASWTIWAYSPSLNEEHRWFDLHNTSPVTDQRYAKQLADAAAQKFNTEQRNRATDWIGRIKLEELGIQTLDGYIK